MEGIPKEYTLPPPVESDVYLMTEQERLVLEIEALPGSLWEAIQVTEDSDLVHNAIEDYVFRRFIENKKIEWEQYNSQVSEYEINRNLSIL